MYSQSRRLCSWNIHYDQEGFKTTPTIKQEMLAAIIFGKDLILVILLEESGWGPNFFFIW